MTPPAKQGPLKRTMIVLNNYLHDFATGYWIAALITIWLLDVREEGGAVALVSALGEIERFFFWNTVVAMVVILATGGMRAAAYVPGVFGEESEAARRTILIVKHVIMLLAFAAGSYLAYRLAY